MDICLPPPALLLSTWLLNDPRVRFFIIPKSALSGDLFSSYIIVRVDIYFTLTIGVCKIFASNIFIAIGSMEIDVAVFLQCYIVQNNRAGQNKHTSWEIL